MKHYTAKQVNEIKQEIRTGKPLPIIAEDLSQSWKRPVSGIYTKVLQLSKLTRKINNTYTGPTKRRRKKKTVVKKEIGTIIPPHLWDVTDQGEVVLIKQEDVIVGKEELTIEEFSKIWDGPQQEPAEICIEVPTGNISFIGTPSRVVIYSDHVRYYYNN
jgi:hypothetical protein